MTDSMDTLRKKSDSDLAKALKEARESLRTSRFSAAGGKARNTKEARDMKKNIARILTEQNARAQKSE